MKLCTVERASKQGAASCTDPVYVKVTQSVSILSSCKVFLKENNSIYHFHCQTKICTWEFVAAVVGKGKDPHDTISGTKWQMPTGCFITASQLGLSCTVQSRPEGHAFVHNTGQACTCLGYLLYGSLTPPCAMVFWSGSLQMYAYIPILHLHIKSSFSAPKWTDALYSNLLTLQICICLSQTLLYTVLRPSSRNWAGSQIGL